MKTHLTLVPCSENFLLQDVALFDTTAQFLVFNEFEQRFSASRSVRCFKEFELCAMGTGVDRAIDDNLSASNSCQRSVFSAFVSGTLTGQTRIRGVDDGSPHHGNGLLGVAEEFYRAAPTSWTRSRSSDAFNLHYAGDRATPDFIRCRNRHFAPYLEPGGTSSRLFFLPCVGRPPRDHGTVSCPPETILR